MHFSLQDLIAIVLATSANLFMVGFSSGRVRADLRQNRAEIERLEKKQDKHNGLFERLATVEQEQKGANARIKNLETAPAKKR